MIATGLPTIVQGSGPAGVPLTMSSREIADLLGARHDSVKRTMERLRDKGLIRFTPTEETSHEGPGARPVEVYNVGKRDSYVIVAQMSPEFTARLVDRWQELEAGAAAHLPRLSSLAREARLQFKMMVGIANAVGIKGNQAALAANNGVRALLGVDVLGSMGATHLPAPQNEALLSPSDIAVRLGGGMTARKVNLLLTAEGYQTAFRDAKGDLYYEPTEAGAEAGGVMQDTGKRHSNGTPVRQLKWASRIVNLVRDIADHEEHEAA